MRRPKVPKKRQAVSVGVPLLFLAGLFWGVQSLTQPEAPALVAQAREATGAELVTFARQLYAIEGRAPSTKFVEIDVKRMYPSVEPARLGEVTALVNKAHSLLEAQTALERLERPSHLREVHARILGSYQAQSYHAWQDLDAQVHPEHWQAMASLRSKYPAASQDDWQADWRSAHQELRGLLVAQGISRSQVDPPNSLWD